MAILVIRIDEDEKEHTLGDAPMLIGRRPDCAITIAAASVSGRHAQIQCQDGVFVVEDVGSRNGTFVNDQRITSPVRLQHNDTLQFGSAVARFHAPTALPPTDAGAALAAPPIAAESQETPTPSLALVDIDEANEPTITDKMATAGRFGILEVNPEAKLKAVLEISNHLAGTVDLSSLLPKILDSLFGIFRNADRGCILLKDEATDQLVPRAMRHRREDEDSTVRLSRTIIDKVRTEKTGILSADASTDAAFSNSESIADINIRSMMCVPLLGSQDQVLGILSIDSLNTLRQFTHDDLDILMTVAGQAALAYENAQLAQAYAEKQKQDAEMEIARSVQRALLPTELPKVEGYQFFASYDSARAVGGDMYDCFELPDGKICLSFGDVAGKGVPGALIMSRMDSCVQSTIRHVHDVVEAICAINEHMCDSNVEGRFVTHILCIVDTHSHEVVLVNAGHMPPIIRRADGSMEKFDEERSGPPICVVDDYPYEAQTCKLGPGDLVVMYTDGVDEAMNPAGELYGSQRVWDFVKNGPPEAQQMGKLLLEDVRRHAQGYPQSDDITIMAFGRNPAP